MESDPASGGSDDQRPDPTVRFATEDEKAALERSIEDEEEFDRHLGRLVRSMATLEDVLDEFLIDHLAPPWGRDIFWSRFLERRGVSQKASDVLAITEFWPEPQAQRFSEIVEAVKNVARRRNLLVHGVIEIGLPIGDSATPFIVVHPQRDAGRTKTTTVSELSDLVQEVDAVTYQMIEVMEDPAAW